MKELIIGSLIAAALVLLPAAPALANWYNFYGYDPTTQTHSLCLSKPDGTESPYPLRWWPAVGYSTASTWYKLGTTLDSNFRTACTNAESNWESLWGGGTQMFFWTLDTNPITDSTDRAIGMTQLGIGVAGEVFFIDNEAWHPWQYSQRMGRNVHAYLRWYMRFQSTMTNTQMPNDSGGHWDWGTGSAQWILDRESITTHEFGHTIALMHPDQISYSDPQQRMPTTTTSMETERKHLEDSKYGRLLCLRTSSHPNPVQ